MSLNADVLIVGSGPTGILATQRLIDLGRRVLLVDAGSRSDRFPISVPEQSFVELRREDQDQHRYLLGESFEGISTNTTGPLAQATPPRQSVFQRAIRDLAVDAPGFAAIESLVAGGLGEAWGGVAFPFTPSEIKRSGLGETDLSDHYDPVSRTIGICGDVDDDLTPWRGAVSELQAAPAPDPNAAAILRRYAGRRRRCHDAGFRIGRPLLAMLTRQLGARDGTKELGLEFLSNPGGSVFRPSVLFDSLKRSPGLEYVSGLLVLRFSEKADGKVEIAARDVETGEPVTLTARVVLLAAGALGTTRIVLRSLNHYDRPVPLVCNRHSLLGTIRWGGIGQAPPMRAHALAQLTAIYDPTRDQEHLVQSQLYSYTGLPLAKLLRETPLPAREAIRALRTISAGLITLVIQHEDEPGPSKQCALRQGTAPEKDVLEVRYRPSDRETADQQRAEKRLTALVRTLGCWPLRMVHAPAGSSVHYAGMFPTNPKEEALTTDRTGRLRGTRAVYLADGAALRYLPAKGLTLTIMANGRRIASSLAREPATVWVNQ